MTQLLRERTNKSPNRKGGGDAKAYLVKGSVKFPLATAKKRQGTRKRHEIRAVVADLARP